MVTGRVVRFDAARGFGFIAPDSGGDDVFLHVNDLLIPESCLRTGLAVEFDVEDGGRGLKASAVRLAGGADVPPGRSAAVARPVDADDPMCDVLSAEEFTRDVTELLLEAAPSLTGDQILQARRQMLAFGKKHGWVEG